MTAASGLERLDDRQRALIEAWLPGAVVEHDHSWGLLPTTVLEITTPDERRLGVKAGGPDDRHLAREIHAHQHWTTPWTTRERTPRLVHADRAARILITTWLPGDLVQDTSYASDPGVYRQAGELLHALHDQHAVVDDGEFEEQGKAKALRLLDNDPPFDPATTARLRDLVDGFDTPPAVLVPTHGDWQPRNWLVDENKVAVIDFGRAALRPALTDLTRLAVRHFAWNPRLETAFLAGYGTDPRARDPQAWFRERAREAIGTTVWARQVGDRDFEREGHAMVRAVLDEEVRVCR